MMKSEMSDLLTIRAGYHGNMAVGLSDVHSWHQVIGDLDARDALKALYAHYSQRAEFAMPADIRNGVKRIRADRMERAPIAQPPPDLDPDDVAAYLRWHAGWIRSAGDDQPERPAVAS